MLPSHAPEHYNCPFCLLVNGGDVAYPWSCQSDVVYQNAQATVFICANWWPNNPGHVLVVPNRHIEHIYALTPDIAVHVHEAARQAALAFKAVYQAEGTSTRQHNEPAGYQEVWHYHLHVFPRYTNDYLYDLTHQRRLTTPEERLPYAQKLRAYFDARRDDLTSEG
ncbi:MAG: HIT family protein [Anaerolineae bacterium]